MQAGAHGRKIGRFEIRLLDEQRKRHCGARRLEAQEAAVAGPVDDAAAGLPGETAHEFAMSLGQIRDDLVAGLRLQPGGVHQVRENQREDARVRGLVGHTGHGSAGRVSGSEPWHIQADPPIVPSKPEPIVDPLFRPALFRQALYPIGPDDSPGSPNFLQSR